MFFILVKFYSNSLLSKNDFKVYFFNLLKTRAQKSANSASYSLRRKEKTNSALSKIVLVADDSVLNNKQKLSIVSEAPYLIAYSTMSLTVTG